MAVHQILKYALIVCCVLRLMDAIPLSTTLDNCKLVCPGAEDELRCLNQECPTCADCEAYRSDSEVPEERYWDDGNTHSCARSFKNPFTNYYKEYEVMKNCPRTWCAYNYHPSTTSLPTTLLRCTVPTGLLTEDVDFDDGMPNYIIAITIISIVLLACVILFAVVCKYKCQTKSTSVKMFFCRKRIQQESGVECNFHSLQPSDAHNTHDEATQDHSAPGDNATMVPTTTPGPENLDGQQQLDGVNPAPAQATPLGLG